MYVQCIQAWWPQSQKRAPGTGIMEGCEPLCRYRALHFGPLQEQQVVLAYKLSLQPLGLLFKDPYITLWFFSVSLEKMEVGFVFVFNSSNIFNSLVCLAGIKQWMKYLKVTTFMEHLVKETVNKLKNLNAFRTVLSMVSRTSISLLRFAQTKQLFIMPWCHLCSWICMQLHGILFYFSYQFIKWLLCAS